MRGQELADKIYLLLEKNNFMNMRQLKRATGESAGKIRGAYDYVPGIAETDNGFVFLPKNYNREQEEILLKKKHS